MDIEKELTELKLNLKSLCVACQAICEELKELNRKIEEGITVVTEPLESKERG